MFATGTLFLIANTYYEGKLVDALIGWKKYYQIGDNVIIPVRFFFYDSDSDSKNKKIGVK